MSQAALNQNLGPPPAKKIKVGVACLHCRSKKVKCDGARPSCETCRKKNENCTYTDSPGLAKRRSPVYARLGTETTPSPRPRRDPPSASSERPSERLNDQEVRGTFGGGVPGVFAGEVKAAIDARLGLPSGGRPSLVPMTDAPLFGLLSRRQATQNSSSVDHVDNVLPPRKHADHLMGTYWQHIQPLEPFLEQERFSQSYEALFTGGALNADERIFVSTLNTVFALSTQVQECIPREQREEASNTYFHRAWTLLRPETIIWEPGSLELVQCLLLMSRYLQCTNNPHQTWMALGSAVRIAQSLSLHIPEASSSRPPNRDTQLRRQVWQCCVFMDRAVSWIFGRTSMVPLAVSPAGTDPLHGNDLNRQRVRAANFFTKMLELYEIANHIMLAQAPTRSTFADILGLPRLYQNDEYFNTALQFDTFLNKWEKDLPPPLRLDVSQGDVDDVSYRHKLILRLRLLHSRIHLFRPMLAGFCLSQSQAAKSPAVDQGLGDRFVQQCASLCVDNAQKMIDLIHEHHKIGEPVGILPWWHRVFYLHVAGTILIAAMLRAELFTPVVSQSWGRAMSALRAHEHLSPFIEQCATTFHTLSCKISETQHRSQFPLPGGSSNTYFQDVFQDLGFDPDNFLFGKEDMSWLSNLDPAQ